MPHNTVLFQQLLNQKRRKARAEFSPGFVTHLIRGSSSIPVTPLVTDDLFPDRSLPITFQTRIRILGEVAQGLIFEFGSSTRGAAAWVEGTGIGFVAGDGDGEGLMRGTAFWDLEGTLETSREFQLTFAIIPGSGAVRLWNFGRREANGVATNNDFGPGDWADTENGSFASAPVGTVMDTVPVGSRIAPSNFEVIQQLKIFNHQAPMGFNPIPNG